MFEDGNQGCGGGDFLGADLFGARGLERCCRNLVEESRGGCRGRRKELQELAQGGRAGMLRCGQGFVLVRR